MLNRSRYPVLALAVLSLRAISSERLWACTHCVSVTAYCAPSNYEWQRYCCSSTPPEDAVYLQCTPHNILAPDACEGSCDESGDYQFSPIASVPNGQPLYAWLPAMARPASASVNGKRTNTDACACLAPSTHLNVDVHASASPNHVEEEWTAGLNY